MLGAAVKGGTRFAGNALKYLFKDMGKGEIAMRIAPDLMFGGIEAAMTPGDIADKAIAGAGSALGGSMGGLALGRLGGPGALGTVLDMAGSIGGDMIGREGATAILRGKDKLSGGQGLSPYEKMSQQQQLEMLQAGRTQALAELGLLPGGYQENLTDPTTGMGVS